MDTKQANLTEPMCRYHLTKVGLRHKSRVNNQKEALQPPFLPCGAAREMESKSLWKSSRMTYRINKKPKKKEKKQVSSS